MVFINLRLTILLNTTELLLGFPIVNICMDKSQFTEEVKEVLPENWKVNKTPPVLDVEADWEIEISDAGLNNKTIVSFMGNHFKLSLSENTIEPRHSLHTNKTAEGAINRIEEFYDF